MYILGEIKQVDDIYSLEEVNCLEKPLGIMLNSFNSLYRNIYLLLQKMTQSYNIKYYCENIFRQKNTMERSRDILEREMGIKLYRIEDPEDLLGCIKGKLAENNPVIVPVNLRELYYSSFYNKENWIHSFLIFGYNEENRLFNIFDSTQRHDEGGYNLYKFVVEEDTLYRMHKSFSEHIYEEGIYYVISKDISLDVDIRKYLCKCVYHFCYLRVENPYIELDFIGKVLKENRVNQQEIRRLMRICHYKKVFYNELEGLLRIVGIDSALLDKYIAIRDELVKKWSKINGKIMYYLYKKMMGKVQEEVQHVLVIEETMLSCMKEILKKLEEDKIITTLSHEDVNFVNNSDNIISKVSDNEFIFKFDNGKIYNNWFEDCAPKIIFNDVKNYNNFVIKAKFVLEEYTEGSNFVLGIYLKDNMGSSYIFGLNSGVSILFEHTGVNNAILEIEHGSCITDIEIEIVNQQLYINYRGDEKKETYAAQTQIKGGVVCVGICCKTWGEAQKLRFRVKDIEIEM